MALKARRRWSLLGVLLPLSLVIAFYSNQNGNEDIYVVQADGTGLRQLTTHTSSDMAPAVSPDGSRIAFVSDRSGDREIYTISIDGTDLERLGFGEHILYLS